MNRAAFTWPSSRPVGACIWIAVKYRALADECHGNGISGNDARPYNRYRTWRDQATTTLGVNWWMLTQRELKSITERETGFKNGHSQEYAKNLFWPTVHALGLAGIDHSLLVKSTPTYWVFNGSGNSVPVVGHLPFDSAVATTIGAVMFVDEAGRTDDLALMSHEYIHIMQYSTNQLQEQAYIGTCVFVTGMVDCGTPKNRCEAIAYLWSAWLYNYHRYGGPTKYDPRYYWKTPTTEQILAAGPWPF